MTVRFVGQIKKLKEELNTVQCRNASPQRQVHGHAAAHRRDGTPTLRPRKRRLRILDSDSHANDSDLGDHLGETNPPCLELALPPLNSRLVSREKIRSVLGGFDRGWGSTWYVSVPLSQTRLLGLLRIL